MTTVYLALGSNVGDSTGNIAQAVKLLGNSVQNIKRAPLYASKAAGYTDQPDFVNTAVCGETSLNPEQLLNFVKDIEQQIGRINRFRWGPREIDIDIIFYGDSVLESEKLTIPHPRFAERDFVLLPLSDLNPGLIDPISHQAVQQLLAKTETTGKFVIKQVDVNA